jgi:glycosyltransferase involved in cell wall biosynthesis
MTSIIIPTYNRAHLISRAIESVLSQTFTAWELIIVDDGSTDDTNDVLKRYLSDPRIKYIKKANSGAAESRNVGAVNATQYYITFLDSDDEAEPQWLEKMVTAAKEENVAVVCCGLRRFNDKGELIGTDMPYKLGPIFENVEGRFTNGGVYLLRRELFEAFGGFDVALKSGQHTELALRLIPYIKTQNLVVVSLQEPLIRVHIHAGPRIRYNYEAIYLGSTRILEKHEERFKRDMPVYVVYLAIAGVNALRTKRYGEAKRYFWKAIAPSDYHPRSWFRWIVSHIPFVRDRVWRRYDQNT